MNDHTTDAELLDDFFLRETLTVLTAAREWCFAHLSELVLGAEGADRGWAWSMVEVVAEREQAALDEAFRMLTPSERAGVLEQHGQGWPLFSLSFFDDLFIEKCLWPNRPCFLCGETPTIIRGERGWPLSMVFLDDPCIEDLAGVSNACCGHGDRSQAYVSLVADDEVLYGTAAIARLRELGGSPPSPASRSSSGTGIRRSKRD